MNRGLVFILIIVLTVGCKKKQMDCNYSSLGNFGFTTYETVLDSIFETDTPFANREIIFKVNGSYSNISWTIGGDSRKFTSSRVNLKFRDPENILVQLSAMGINKSCTAEAFTVAIPFILLPSDGTVKFPLVGSYKGYNTDSPKDTFTISIKFWFGGRYPWWSDGAYSVENLPGRYSDTTKNINGFNVPEIKGIIAAAGYKHFAIDKTGNYPAMGIKGYGHLKRGISDTIIFSYSLMDTLKLSQTGQITYRKKLFWELKNKL